MALQSQTPRPPQRLVPAESRRGLTPAMKALLAATCLAAIAAGVVLAFRLGGSARTVAQTPPTTDPLAATDITRIDPSPAPAATPPAPAEPTLLEMGRKPATTLAAGTVPATNPSSGLIPPAGTPVSPPTATPPGQPDQAQPPAGSPAPSVDPVAPAVAPPPVSEAQRLMMDAGRAQSAGNLVEARSLLNRALLDTRVPSNERGALRAQIAALNETLIFSSSVAKGDPFCDTYTIAGGDSLVKVRAKLSLPIDWRFLQRINRVDPSALRIGQKLKIIRAPFHAVVHKSDFRLDLFIGDPLPPGAATTPGPDGQDPSWVYVRSFRVGLGEVGPNSPGTPEGLFTVRPNSKLTNPLWVNPRTGEKFAADNPMNPIGEHWIGIDGADDASRKFTGYGLHGTIDPGSIGQQKSMGCVRLGADDIALLYDVLVERVSTVRIVK